MAGAITLSSGYKMPIIGLGVWRLEGKSIKALIHSSIKIGYRHFDCAADYQNEAEVGEALKEAFQTGLVKREELFITTKLWNSDHGHVLEACKDSMKKLQLEYLDLFLVHFPVATRHTGVGTTDSALDEDGVLDIDTTISLETTWHAMEDLVSQGLVRSIGISNYDIFLTRDCLAYSKIKPAVNQFETHPYFQRDSLVKFCEKHGICVTAHTPVGGAAANAELFGTVSCLDDPVIQELAQKYNKTAAQLVLRWGIQRNTVVIPKSSKLERLQENFQVFDFTISDEDMQRHNELLAPKLFCDFCQRPGHIRRDCRRANDWCLVCGDKNHKTANCPGSMYKHPAPQLLLEPPRPAVPIQARPPLPSQRQAHQQAQRGAGPAGRGTDRAFVTKAVEAESSDDLAVDSDYDIDAEVDVDPQDQDYFDSIAEYMPDV